MACVAWHTRKNIEIFRAEIVENGDRGRASTKDLQNFCPVNKVSPVNKGKSKLKFRSKTD